MRKSSNQQTAEKPETEEASDIPDHLQYFLPAYLKELVDEPTTDNIELFIEVDLKSGCEYIPVFEEFAGAESFVVDHSGLQLDKHLCIYAFPTLVKIKKKFRTIFGRAIELKLC